MSLTWQALRQPPWRFLTSRWPWRAQAYLLSGVALGVLVTAVVVVLVATAIVLSVSVVGMPLVVASVLVGTPVAVLERHRLGLLAAGMPQPVRDRHPREGLTGRISARLREPATWRELTYTALVAVLWPVEAGVLLLAVALPAVLVLSPVFFTEPGDLVYVFRVPLRTSWQGWLAAVVIWILGAYLVTAVAAGRAALAHLLLSSREEALGARVTELTRSRARLMDTFAAEHRRIERDLHDGAQQRIVALTMTLGLARLALPAAADTREAATLLDRAHDEAKQILAELRELVRGIHPRILVDRGLAAAIHDRADRTPLPVTVTVDLPRHLPDDIELVAYFVVSEALTNIVKHSQAGHATVTARLADDHLFLEVTDDGIGGARLDGGTGLTGLGDRVSVIDGTLTLTSPYGGPTTLRMSAPVPSRPRA